MMLIKKNGICYLVNFQPNQLHFCREVRPPPSVKECPRYHPKSLDGEISILELWGMWRTSLLPSLPGPLGICRTSNQPDDCGTKPFLGGSGRRAVAKTCPKCLGPRRHSYKKAPQAPGDKSRLSEEDKSQEGRSPETGRESVLGHLTWMPASRNPCQAASTDSHWSQDTPYLIRVLGHTASWNVSQPSG